MSIRKNTNKKSNRNQKIVSSALARIEELKSKQNKPDEELPSSAHSSGDSND